MLKEYVGAATDTEAESILIGGVVRAPPIFMENEVAQLNPKFQLCTNEDVCLLAQNPRPTHYFPLDSDEPFSIVWIPDNSRSVKRPAPRVPDVEPRSLEQPADRDITLTSATPLYDNLIEELEPAAQGHYSGAELIEYITKCCYQGDLLYLDAYGEFTPTPIPLPLKMEEMLRAAVNQRDLQRGRLKKDTRSEASRWTCV